MESSSAASDASFLLLTDAGITMSELCTRFLSDESSFYVDFHHAKGDEQATISRWRTHRPLGRVRELQFITALKVRFRVQGLLDQILGDH